MTKSSPRCILSKHSRASSIPLHSDAPLIYLCARDLNLQRESIMANRRAGRCPGPRPLARSEEDRSACSEYKPCVPSWLLEGIIYNLTVSGQVIELVHSLSLTCSLLLPPSVKVCSILPSSLSHFRRIEPEDNEAGWVEDFSILAHQWLRFMIISFSCVRCPLYSLGCCTKRCHCLPSGRNASREKEWFFADS